MRLWRVGALACIAAAIGPACGAGVPGDPGTNGERDESAVAVFPSGASFQLEIAADPESVARGYGFREEVGPGEGMLFVFPDSARRSFWMKDCLVSLDIIWLDERFRVVHIEHALPPCPADGECPAVQPPRPARYVLEVAGGKSEAHGLTRGDVLEILSESPLF